MDALDEGGTVTLTVTHSGGVYDTIDYIWQVLSGGGTITGTDASVTYNAPNVSADRQVTVAVTGTARGMGTLAVSGTFQSTSDQEVFTVRSTTDVDNIWRLSARDTAPATPTGGQDTEEHTPTGWMRTQPSASETQAVWRSQRIRNLSGGVFVSAATWQTPTRVADELLALSDALVPDGRTIIGEVSLITVPSDGDVFDSNATVVAGADPPNLGADDLTATRIYVTGNDQLRVSDSGTGDIGTLYSSGGDLEDYQVHVQTSHDDVVSFGSDDIDAGRTTAARLILGERLDPNGVLDDVSALVGGNRVLWFVTDDVPPAPLAGASVTDSPTVAGDLSRTYTTPLAGGVSSGSPAVGGDLIAMSTAGLAGDAASGTPAVAGGLSQIYTTPLAGDAASGTPTVDGGLAVTGPPMALPLAGNATGGTPTVSGDLASTTAAPLAGDAASGTPDVSGSLSRTYTTPLSGDAQSGTPDVDGDLATTTLAGLAGEAQSGTPDVAGNLSRVHTTPVLAGDATTDSPHRCR